MFSCIKSTNLHCGSLRIRRHRSTIRAKLQCPPRLGIFMNGWFFVPNRTLTFLFQLSEQEQNSARELERLRRHLVETEENYTQELMTSEQKLTECQTRLHSIEERAKQTSTVYTSNRYV